MPNTMKDTPKTAQSAPVEKTVTVNVAKIQIVGNAVYKPGVQEVPEKVATELKRRDKLAPLPSETPIETVSQTPAVTQ